MDPSLHPIVDAGYMDLEHPWIQVSYINGLGMEPISSLQSFAHSVGIISLMFVLGRD